MSKIDNILHWLEASKVIIAPVLIGFGVPPAQAEAAAALAAKAEQAMGPGTGRQKLQYVVNGVADGMNAAGALPAHVAAVSTAVQDGLTTAIAVTDAAASWHTAAVVEPATAGHTTGTVVPS